MGNCLDAAIKYATKYGWAVFPCSQSTKKPLTPHGCLDAKKDVGAIRAWWKKHPDASIGVATGSMSNLIVIDEDIDENKDINGARSVRAWEKVNGRSGNSAHTKGKAVDIRCNTSSNRYKIVAAALACGVRRIGIGKTFVHIDNDGTLPQGVIWDYYDE